MVTTCAPADSRGRAAARRGAVVAWLLGLAGCTTTLEPPRVDGPTVTVYLMDHGRHPSLVLPDHQGRAWRYAYGDWAWFAEGRTGFLRGAAALLWPTRASLGRQQLDPWGSTAALRRQIREGFVELYAFEVARGAALELSSRLDGIYLAGAEQATVNPALSLTHVPHPERYWGLNNSNVVTARWLQSLGIEVRGFALLSRWEIAAPAAATDAAPDPVAIPRGPPGWPWELRGRQSGVAVVTVNRPKRQAEGNP